MDMSEKFGIKPLLSNDEPLVQNLFPLSTTLFRISLLGSHYASPNPLTSYLILFT